MLRHPGLLTPLLAVLAAGNAAIQPRGSRSGASQEWHVWLGIRAVPAAQRWNSFSRIRAEPALVSAGDVGTVNLHAAVRSGADEAKHRRIGRHDNVPVRRRRPRKTLGFSPMADVTGNFAYLIRNPGPVGGDRRRRGTDLLSAHLFGFADVTGVELNPIFINWLTE